jgi:hypothetical protein
MIAIMLLPAMQSARETARRFSCQNNLRGIGIATLNFESSFRHFQPGYLGSKGSTVEDTNCVWIGSLAFLLPYLEQESSFKIVDSSRCTSIQPSDTVDPLRLRNWWDPTDRKCLEIAGMNVPIFVCPSDAGEFSKGYIVAVDTWITVPEHLVIGRKTVELSQIGRLGASNYIGTSGLGGGIGGAAIASRRGILFNRSKTKYRDILDGTTNTILYGEVTGDWETKAIKNARTHHFAWMGSGSIPIIGGLVGERRFGKFGSLHPCGLVSFVFADASVRALSSSTDAKILLALGSMANDDKSTEE